MVWDLDLSKSHTLCTGDRAPCTGSGESIWLLRSETEPRKYRGNRQVVEGMRCAIDFARRDATKGVGKGFRSDHLLHYLIHERAPT